MSPKPTTCSRCVDESVKNGKTRSGKQRYLCRSCGKCYVLIPSQLNYGNRFDQSIVNLIREGCGIRSIARLLCIAPSTVIKLLIRISETIIPPTIPLNLERIQVDELHTFVATKSKGVYVIYSWSNELKRVLTIAVGRRSKSNLRLVVNPLLEADVQSINTDKYSGYKGVVPIKRHTTFKRRNNGIERHNLTLRTHLKRLNRRTICFSKSLAVLVAVVKIYCWY